MAQAAGGEARRTAQGVKDLSRWVVRQLGLGTSLNQLARMGRAKSLAAVVVCCCAGAAARGQQNTWQVERLGFGNSHPLASMPSPEQLEGVVVNPEARGAVGQLDDPSFDTRERATAVLLDVQTDKLQLYAILNDRSLTTEQRYRLLAVLRQKLVSTPRGALGISTRFQDQQPQLDAMGQPAGVRVAELLPGLPAERVLQVGDRITHVDGVPLIIMGDLQFRVQSKRPGEKVQLTVKRQKNDAQGQPLMDDQGLPIAETMQIELALGSAELLKSVGARFGQNNDLSDVERQRLQEADHAADVFAPAARQIPVRGGEVALLATTLPSHPQDLEVDEHPAIQRLLSERTWIARNQQAESPEDRQRWRQRLSELYDRAGEPTLGRQEREFLLRVIERYTELLRD
ncbi:MAG: PDZ domain-containing protein [Phycisphaerales bacterium]|nr:PDZ domain-containing protein [Phycisphaerales bacterium]